jgi:hypothetical protein
MSAHPRPRAPRSTGQILLIVFGIAGVALAGFAAALLFAVSALMRQSTPYEEGLARARGDARVVAALGRPVEGGSLVQGRLQTSNDDAEAAIHFSLEGPAGTARMRVEGQRRGGRWT